MNLIWKIKSGTETITDLDGKCVPFNQNELHKNLLDSL